MTERTTVWLIDDERLVSVRHDVASPAGPDAVVADLASGPSAVDLALGLRSALPDPAVIESVTVSRGTAAISVAASFAEIPAADQLLAIAQLVLTLTGIPGIGAVTFISDGAALAVPDPDGETIEGPVYREQYLPMT